MPPFAHRLQAGADILLAPTRSEPCGLTQMYALRYGTLPVVRKTGGLADTVADVTAASLAARTASGLVFEETTPAALAGAVGRALALYHQPRIWRRLKLRLMSQDFSWSRSAAMYAGLYRQILDVRDLPQPEALLHQAIEATGGRQAAT